MVNNVQRKTSRWLNRETHDISEIQAHKTGLRKSYISRDRLNGDAALLVVYPKASNAWEAEEQCRREIAALKQISHPNLPRLWSVEESDYQIVLVMEEILGQPLSEILRFRQISVNDLEQVIRQILDALEYLHEGVNLGHGAVTPENILFQKKGRDVHIALAGFGSSRLNGSSVENPLSIAVTPGFLPKEQACNPELTAEADHHALGVSILCAMTRTSPGDAARFVDSKTGAVVVPFQAYVRSLVLALWVKRMVDIRRPYRSAQEARDGLDKLKAESQRWVYQSLRAAAVGLMVSLVVLPGAWIHQQIQISVREEEYAEVLAKADMAYSAAEARMREAIRRAEEQRKAAEAAAREQQEKEQQLAAQRELNRVKETGYCPGCNLQGVDLSSLDLGGANLQGATLAGANLASARLEGADLRGANLASANLGMANLKRADLSGSVLKKANLKNSSVIEACLEGADLSSANFSGAEMTNASFERARIESALFGFFPLRKGAIGPTGEVWYGETTTPPACR